MLRWWTSFGSYTALKISEDDKGVDDRKYIYFKFERKRFYFSFFLFIFLIITVFVVLINRANDTNITHLDDISDDTSPTQNFDETVQPGKKSHDSNQDKDDIKHHKTEKKRHHDKDKNSEPDETKSNKEENPKKEDSIEEEEKEEELSHKEKEDKKPQSEKNTEEVGDNEEEEEEIVLPKSTPEPTHHLSEKKQEEMEKYAVAKNQDEDVDYTSLSRLYRRGVPLVDTWPKNQWKIKTETYKSILSLIGDPKHELVCKKSTEQKQVRLAFSPGGFGSIMLSLSDMILYAYSLEKQFAFISRRYKKNTGEGRWNDEAVFNNEFEDSFSFFVSKETGCFNFYEAGCSKVNVCRGPGWSEEPVPRLNYIAAHHLDFFLGTRVELLRMLTRLKETTRKKVDAKLTSVDFSKKNIAIHIRRGDKYREAVFVPESYYLEASFMALGQLDQAIPLDTVIITTDHGASAHELVQLWKASKQGNSEYKPVNGFLIRNSVEGNEGRADRVHDRGNSTKTYLAVEQDTVDLLADIKCLVGATLFVGTQSSNFGVLVCYLRGGTDCFNVEKRKAPYAWNHHVDKVY